MTWLVCVLTLAGGFGRDHVDDQQGHRPKRARLICGGDPRVDTSRRGGVGPRGPGPLGVARNAGPLYEAETRSRLTAALYEAPYISTLTVALYEALYPGSIKHRYTNVWGEVDRPLTP